MTKITRDHNVINISQCTWLPLDRLLVSVIPAQRGSELPYRILVVGKTRTVVFSFKEHIHEKEFTLYQCEGKTIDVLDIKLFVPWDKNSY